MPKLVSLKLSKADAKKQSEPSTLATEAPRYPWGLSLRLDDATIEKLGLETLPKVGTSMTLIATVEVTGVSSNEHQGGKNREVNLQLVEACLEGEGSADKAARALYGKE